MSSVSILNPKYSDLSWGLTVIVPTRNRHLLLSKTLESLLGLPEISTIVIVDDHSAIPVQVVSPKVKIVRNTFCMGEGLSINRAIPFVHTKYLAIVSDDDPQGEEWLPEIFNMIRKKPGYIGYYPSNIFVAEGLIRKRILAVKYYSFEMSYFEFMPCLAGVVMDYELIRSRGIHEIRSSIEFPNDFIQWLHLSRIGRFKPVPRSLARWQIHQNQMSNSIVTTNKSLQYLNNVMEWKSKNLSRFRGLSFSVTIIRYLQMNITRNISWRQDFRVTCSEVYSILKKYPMRRTFLLVNFLLAFTYLTLRKSCTLIQSIICQIYLRLLAKKKRPGFK